jgi:hypothetical protein
MLTDGTKTRWGRRRSGGLTGLQNQLARLNPGLVGSIPTRSRHRADVLVFSVLLIAAVNASALEGQQPPDDPSQNSAEAVEVPDGPGRASPRGAFVRSMLIPGWGQAVSESPGRGAFYFTVQSLGVWMILKTSKTLGSASDILAMRRLDATERLSADPSIGPVDLATAIDADSGVVSALELKEIRRQQREDWLSFGVFFLLLGGADAFVAAHLAGFPDPLEVAIRPLPDMGIEVGFSLPL